MTQTQTQTKSTSEHDVATVEGKPQAQVHPYLVATITPGGGLIVHMHWTDRPPEPLAFTNEADFSSWLKGAVAQCSSLLPRGIQPPRGRMLDKAGGVHEYGEAFEEPVRQRHGFRGLLGGRS